MTVTKERANVMMRLHEVNMELQAEEILLQHHEREIARLQARKAKLINEMRETP